MQVQDFQHDAALRASFNALAHAVFGIDFEAWYQGGYWDDGYRCHAWVEDGQVLATAAASPMCLQFGERMFQARQIGTVMTHRDHRGRGLSTRLMEAVLTEGERAFLFAGKDVEHFYPRFGFRRLRQWDFVMGPGSLVGPRRSGRTLDMAKAADRTLLYRAAGERAPVSRRLAVPAPNLTLWWALNSLQGTFVHIPELDLVWTGRRMASTFHLYDVIAPRMPRWQDLQPWLPLEGVEQIAFHFTPDLIAPRAEAHPASEDDLLYVRGEWELGAGPFRYPLTAQA